MYIMQLRILALSFILVSTSDLHSSGIDWNCRIPDEVVNFLSSFIKHGDLVFDVGANTGYKTDYYLKCGARVVCIEPDEKCVSALCRKFAGNNNVTLEPVALGKQVGSANFFVSSDASTLSTCKAEATRKGRFFVRGYKWDTIKTVPMNTLDQLIQRYGVPQFCKIDVEGFEFEVLQGLSQPIPYIAFEHMVEWTDVTNKCVDHLKDLGYNFFNFAPGERGMFFFETWMPGDQFKEELEKAAKLPVWSEVWGMWGDVYATTHVK